MNEFIPVEVVESSPVLDDDTKANMELVTVINDARIANILQWDAYLKQFQSFKKIETPEQYTQTIEAFDAAKERLKELEGLRHMYVDYQTKVVGLKNGYFRQVREGLERSKGHLGGLIQKKKDEDLAAAMRQREAEEALIEEQGSVEQVLEDGMNLVQTSGSEPVTQIPGNVVETSSGARVHSRETLTVTVYDKKELIKAAIGTNKRFGYLQEVFDEMVEINTAVLKRAIKGKAKIKKVPGVEFEKGKRVV